MRRLDAGESLVQPLEREHQLLVVDAHLVQDGGVEVVHVDLVFDGVVAATPDMTLTREAEQTGTSQWALAKLRPRFASASM